MKANNANDIFGESDGEELPVKTQRISEASTSKTTSKLDFLDEDSDCFMGYSRQERNAPHSVNLTKDIREKESLVFTSNAESFLSSDSGDNEKNADENHKKAEENEKSLSAIENNISENKIIFEFSDENEELFSHKEEKQKLTVFDNQKAEEDLKHRVSSLTLKDAKQEYKDVQRENKEISKITLENEQNIAFNVPAHSPENSKVFYNEHSTPMNEHKDEDLYNKPNTDIVKDSRSFENMGLHAVKDEKKNSRQPYNFLDFKNHVLLYRPLTVALNGKNIVLKQMKQARMVNGQMAECKFSFFEIQIINLEKIKKEGLKYAEQLVSANEADKEKKEVFSDDLVISKNELNSLIYEKDAHTALIQAISKKLIFSGSLGEIIRYKLDIKNEPLFSCADSNKNSYVDNYCLVASTGNKRFIRQYLDGQTDFIRPFIKFYKAGMVSIGEYSDRIFNNLYYIEVIKKINNGENIKALINETTVKPVERKWGLKSLIDKGLFKILDTDLDKGRKEDDKEFGHSQSFKCAEKIDLLSDKEKRILPQPSILQNISQNESILQKNSYQNEAILQNLISEDFKYTGTEVDIDGKNDSFVTESQNDSFAVPNERRNIFDEDDDFDPFGGEMNSDQTHSLNKTIYSSNHSYNETGPAYEEKNEDNFLEIYSSAAKNEVSSQKESELSNNEINNTSIISEMPENSAHETAAEEPKKDELYKNKYSKSFADIFTLGSDDKNSPADLSKFVDDVEENDKPVLLRDFEDSKKNNSSIFNMFGLFSKKKEEKTVEDEKFNRPRKSEMKIPEPNRERKVIKNIYANKSSCNISIPMSIDEDKSAPK
ncbi:hypothetical protein ENBRE01_1357 [Enteropsectra breve]|nr:hypothetical protein ENBRE01_1357 [Enteropsectra breve]